MRRPPLDRLRPVKLRPTYLRLQLIHRNMQALELLKRYCPEHAPEIDYLSLCWPDLLTTFFSWVQNEVEWFPLDGDFLLGLYYDIINNMNRARLSLGLLDSVRGLTFPWSGAWDSHAQQQLARTIELIPILTLGKCGDDEMEPSHSLHKFYSFKLLRALLGHPRTAIPAFKGNPAFYPPKPFHWTRADKAVAWSRLKTTEQSSPEPLCWLTDIARFACGISGNVFLDTSYDQNTWLNPWRWSWDRPEDITFLRRQWAEARPFIERSNAFSRWMLAATKNMQLVFDVITKNPPQD